MDFGNCAWDEPTKTNHFVIGTEPALQAPRMSVTWYCEWNHEKSIYKRIPTVHEVDQTRKQGGTIPVSPQEFALIPNTLALQMKMPRELLETMQEEQGKKQESNQVSEMLQLLGQVHNSLQQVRLSTEHNVGVLQTIEEFLYNMFYSHWQGLPQQQPPQQHQ